MSDVPAFPAPDPATRWESPIAAQPRGKRRRSTWCAVGLLLATAVAVGILFGEGTRRASDAARNFVRVSAGCRVPITLRDTGDFWVYVEEGPVPMPDSAQCTNAGMAMTNPHGLPMLGFAVATPDGVERTVVQLTKRRSYDLGQHEGLLSSRFAGRSGETVIVGVVADAPDVAIAIGENVFSIRTPWRIGAGVVLALGVLLSALVLRVGARR